MFHQFLRDTKKYEIEFTIRGEHEGKPVLLTIRSVNAVEAVKKAQARHPGLVVRMIQVNK